MSAMGAETPWHVLEKVSEGQEEIPGLLRGLVTPGSGRVPWSAFDHRLRWTDPPELVVAVLRRLLDVFVQLDEAGRTGVLDLVAARAVMLRVGALRAEAPGMREVLVDGQRAAARLLADGSAEVRSCAARAIEQVRAADPGTLEALRRQATVEADPATLGRHLIAAGEVLAALGASRPPGWLDPWLDHSDPHVRLAARSARLTSGEVTATTSPAATATATATAAPLTGSPDARRAAVEGAGARLCTWRNTPAGTWETVLAGLSDDDLLTSHEAHRIVARGGSSLAPYADLLVPDRWRAGERADHLVRGLMGIGDARALPWYLKRADSYWMEVESLPAEWAQSVLPALLVQVGGPRTERVLRILTGWGPAAAPAVPHLTGLLDTPHARAAAGALGRIGPAAVDAAGLLAALAKGGLRPRRFAGSEHREPRRWHGVQTAAWAYWRVTGDPGLALDALEAATRGGLARPVLSHLCELGPLAAGYADALRPLLGSLGEWTRVGAAEAWWRLTGDAETAVAALLPELHPLSEQRAGPLVLRVVTALGVIGRPAAAAVPLLTEVIVAERRYGGDILHDEELCRVVRTALAAID
ncbi:hypothetical protein PV721_09140 [Streptomyces sp. MB09-01]|uniref:hypothetical protein n=1 Tax=Streptomyces sp. MB09-01 TaxID=3028666 RepID=UPI0029A3F5F2|nr:hypothetical protein [Streptomyces sp. MB09-01]MDX3534532.1 hypothetical protein [Streptomyces sp. MB09-01]